MLRSVDGGRTPRTDILGAMLRSALVTLFVLLPALAAAQETAERPGADAYTIHVQRGIQQLTSGESDNAMTTFREAVEMDESRPEGPYYVGAILRMRGELENALASFQQAATLAERAPRWRARALHAIASTLERIEGRIEDARTAWLEFTRFADAHPTVADASVGRARIQAIDIMNEQELAYVEVRQRIAEREEERRREAEQPRRR